MITRRRTWKRTTGLEIGNRVAPGPAGSVKLLEAVRDEVFPAGMLAGAHRIASVSEEYMKAQAKWKDRTTKARAGLRAYAGADGKRFFIILTHDPALPYPKWLEIRWNGRFSILIPTQAMIDRQGAGLMAQEIELELKGRGSKFRHRATGRFT